MVLKLDSVLEEYAQRAYDFSINLDGRVERLPTCKSRGGFALVYKGTLLPAGIEVAVKTPVSKFSGDESVKIIKVRILEVYLRPMTLFRILSAKYTPGQNCVTRTSSHCSELPRNLIILSLSCLNGWKGEMHMIMFKIKTLILALWYVAMAGYKWYLHPAQIEGIARGLHYLHNYKLGPIFHGDLKGVSVFSFDMHPD